MTILCPKARKFVSINFVVFLKLHFEHLSKLVYVEMEQYLFTAYEKNFALGHTLNKNIN